MFYLEDILYILPLKIFTKTKIHFFSLKTGTYIKNLYVIIFWNKKYINFFLIHPSIKYIFLAYSWLFSTIFSEENSTKIHSTNYRITVHFLIWVINRKYFIFPLLLSLILQTQMMNQIILAIEQKKYLIKNLAYVPNVTNRILQ